MKMKGLTSLVAVLGFICLLAGCDPYGDMLKKQGYKQLAPPRDAYGTGTIIVAGHPDDIKAGPDDCFPDLDPKIKEFNQVLPDTKDSRNLSLDISGKYLPVTPATIQATFGYKSLKKLDVSFGQTKGNALTDAAFEQYLEGKKVAAGCIRRLRDPQNRLIVSVARVYSMTYTFHGEKTVGFTVDESALKGTLNAKGVLNYTHNSDESLTISQPMYIAYRDAKFVDMGIPLPEAAQGEDIPVTLRKGQFRILPQ